MTQDEIVEMARDSGMELYGLGKNRARFVYHLEAFAKLIEDKVRQDIIEKNAPVINAINAHVKALEDLLKERGEV